MSIARHHAEWLSLLDISGPFLSMPVLTRAFPQGLDAHDPDLARELRSAYEEWVDNTAGLRPDPAIHHAWVRYVLRAVLGLTERVLFDGQAIPDGVKAVIPEHGETLRPDLIVADPATRAPRMLVQLYPAGQHLEKALPDHLWPASPATRMMELLHATGVRLGLCTNGEGWMLVDAPRGETTGYVTWQAGLWTEEPLTQRAFRSLLGAARFFGVPDDQTLEAMLAESAKTQHDVTDQLGYQVREAVEILIQALDRAEQDQGRALLVDVDTGTLYEAALTVMMRLVFLFAAEERGLLLLGDPIYDQNYAVSTLGGQLRELADKLGEEVLERRYDAWGRLLATFRAVFAGIQHDRLSLLAYGSSLFDPDRFAFLEGRAPFTDWRTTPASSLPVNNRTVLHLIEALGRLRVKIPGGGGTESRRLSFRALDIEQIGHVYEGLLDHIAVRADEVMLGLSGARDQEPEIALAKLERQAARGEKDLILFLRLHTGRLPAALHKGLVNPIRDDDTLRRLWVACGNDRALYERVLPFAGLVRDDDLGVPVIIRAGSVYVTAGPTRRATGTHYTPRSLTEPIVQHTLDPLVYEGPAQGKPREAWQLRSPAELLDLKVCDMAMGSGAFLVQACRYLSERLVEAWEALAPAAGRDGSKPDLRITPDGRPATGAPDETIIPAERDERLTLARRLVADRCLYGVDKNPLAVEMAKLSLWLITMDRGRPFTFLDHALKCGDSLVGVSLEQLQHWDLDTSTTSAALFADMIRTDIEQVITLRRKIEALPVNTPDDQTQKALWLREADARAHNLRRAADDLIRSYYNDLPAAEKARYREALLHAHRDGVDVPERWRGVADLRGLPPFHWELEFPEVFFREKKKGFDAFFGNPPFIGGKRIREALGDTYREALYDFYPKSAGGADYSAYFFLRGHQKVYTTPYSGGTVSLIATNTIAQGDTRETGLNQLLNAGAVIYNAQNNVPWPGTAAVVVNTVSFTTHPAFETYYLDGVKVPQITSYLDAAEADQKPQSLAANSAKSFVGSFVNGMGFVLEPEEAQVLIDKDPRNRDVLFPYLNGEDLNSHPEQSPSRWVINFFDWPLERAEEFPDCMAIIREKVYPVRMQVNREAHRRYWWHYGDKRPALYRTIAPLRRVLAKTRHSPSCVFEFVSTEVVFSDALTVMAFDSGQALAVLSSTLHELWAWKYGSTLGAETLRYSPSDCFETFPFPAILSGLDAIGEQYHEFRRQIMLSRWEGLTATYNRFHDPRETAQDIAQLRALHVEMDQAVASAYGWSDLDLGHGIHTTAQGVRYTIRESARREVLARLLRLNHARYEEEVKAGLHDKGAKKGKGKRGKVSPRGPAITPGDAPFEAGDAGSPPPEQLDLLDDDDEKQGRLF